MTTERVRIAVMQNVVDDLGAAATEAEVNARTTHIIEHAERGGNTSLEAHVAMRDARLHRHRNAIVRARAEREREQNAQTFDAELARVRQAHPEIDINQARALASRSSTSTRSTHEAAQADADAELRATRPWLYWHLDGTPRSQFFAARAAAPAPLPAPVAAPRRSFLGRTHLTTQQAHGFGLLTSAARSAREAESAPDTLTPELYAKVIGAWRNILGMDESASDSDVVAELDRRKDEIKAAFADLPSDGNQDGGTAPPPVAS